MTIHSKYKGKRAEGGSLIYQKYQEIGQNTAEHKFLRKVILKWVITTEQNTCASTS